ncbi:MAG: hypothetical protein HKL96_02535 [Phycisphaerales bacterium]|nr:hypothetical protein [Phycisphaerales bacterium]
MSRPQFLPRFIALPLIFSAGFASWCILLASVGAIGIVVLAPQMQRVYEARKQRDSLAASLALLNEKIALQDKFISMAKTNPRLQQRLADRQMNVISPTEKVLPLPGLPAPTDVQSLIDEHLKPIHPVATTPPPWFMQLAMEPAVRGVLILGALVGMALSFLVQIRRVHD